MGKKNKRTPRRDDREMPNVAPAIKSILKQGAREFNDRSFKETISLIEAIASCPLAEQRASIRTALSHLGTDVDANDGDPTGDGDQSPIASVRGRDVARHIYSTGGDITGHLEQGAVPTFALLCVTGNAHGVRSALRAAAPGPGAPPSRSTALHTLLETRVTSLRLSPLAVTVAAGKNLAHPSGAATGADHVGVVAALLEYGARPDARDVLGKTVCHYGAGMMATEMTLDAADMCIRAARSSHLFGKDVELYGLNNAALNGATGVAGGYRVGNDRRAVYLTAHGKEVAVDPANVRLVPSSAQAAPVVMLADVPDRLGSVCLHEVIMGDRVDVAEFLLTKHRASIDPTDPDGCSPRSLARGPTQMASRAAQMVAEAALSGGVEDQKTRRDTRRNTCTYCGVHNPSQTDLPECGKCNSVCYCNATCQKAHWNAGHKQECRIFRHGIQLDRPTGFSAAISFTGSGTTGDSYRRPPGVAVDHKFAVKIQAIDETAPIMLYDETRRCSFDVSPARPGFAELLKAARAEPTWGGRKCFVKASFDAAGVCRVFPETSKLKKHYTW